MALANPCGLGNSISQPREETPSQASPLPGQPGSKHAATTSPQLATHCRMNWMASSYFIPLSMRATATRTGALRAGGSTEVI